MDNSTAEEAADAAWDAEDWVDPAGRRLSDRVWLSAELVERAVENYLRDAARRGVAAEELSKGLGEFLRDPSGGMYPARRLARTELTRAFGQGTIEAAKRNPYIRGVRWRVSGRHPKADPCDVNARGGPRGDGVYPPGRVPPYPNHPMCKCTLSPVVDEDKMAANGQSPWAQGSMTRPDEIRAGPANKPGLRRYVGGDGQTRFRRTGRLPKVNSILPWEGRLTRYGGLLNPRFTNPANRTVRARGGLRRQQDGLFGPVSFTSGPKRRAEGLDARLARAIRGAAAKRVRRFGTGVVRKVEGPNRTLPRRIAARPVKAITARIATRIQRGPRRSRFNLTGNPGRPSVPLPRRAVRPVQTPTPVRIPIRTNPPGPGSTGPRAPTGPRVRPTRPLGPRQPYGMGPRPYTGPRAPGPRLANPMPPAPPALPAPPSRRVVNRRSRQGAFPRTPDGRRLGLKRESTWPRPPGARKFYGRRRNKGPRTALPATKGPNGILRPGPPGRQIKGLPYRDHGPGGRRGTPPTMLPRTKKGGTLRDPYFGGIVPPKRFMVEDPDFLRRIRQKRLARAAGKRLGVTYRQPGRPARGALTPSNLRGTPGVDSPLIIMNSHTMMADDVWEALKDAWKSLGYDANARYTTLPKLARMSDVYFNSVSKLGIKKKVAGALFSIDKVHKDGLLEKIPITEGPTKAGGFDAVFYRAPIISAPDRAMPLGIVVDDRGVGTSLNVAHEIGHHIDHGALGKIVGPEAGSIGFGGAPKWGSARSDISEIAAWRAAVYNSNTFLNLQGALDNGSYQSKMLPDQWLAAPMEWLKYALTPEELWARSYAQYITERSGNLAMTQELHLDLNQNLPSQWESNDFYAIARAIDSIMELLEW